MASFFVTFGPAHARSEPVEITPDGWIELVAPDRHRAREIALAELGRRWAFMDNEEDFAPSRHRYAQGCLAVLTEDGFEGLTTTRSCP